MNAHAQGNTGTPGWAWADPSGKEAALEAARLADFVANTLRTEVLLQPE